MFIKILLCYLALISIVAIIVCIYDKRTAIYNGNHEKSRRRTPERTLFIICALGGSVAMLATMLIIRHKTQHKRFMIGIPLIIIAQIALAVLIKLLANGFILGL